MDIYDKVLGRLVGGMAAAGVVGAVAHPILESWHGETPSDEHLVGMVQPLTMPHGYERDYGTDPRPWGRATLEVVSSAASHAHVRSLESLLDAADLELPSSGFLRLT